MPFSSKKIRVFFLCYFDVLFIPATIEDVLKDLIYFSCKSKFQSMLFKYFLIDTIYFAIAVDDSHNWLHLTIDLKIQKKKGSS